VVNWAEAAFLSPSFSPCDLGTLQFWPLLSPLFPQIAPAGCVLKRA
jgi:hypothetical protein